MEATKEQIAYMQRAIDLAEKARGFTYPNPLVGAVLVKNGKIVGEGYHKKAGTPHAEINAISDALGNAMGATLYVTLEPCSHYGKTPPCAKAIIRAGIKEVFVAMEDSNPLVNGKGIAMLKEAGIIVHTGLLREQAILQNKVFLTNQIQKRAYVVLKSAMSLDGKIGPQDGKPLKITSEESVKAGHLLRRNCGAVLVGINTVINDNPSLTVRYGIETPEKCPTRIVIDPHLRFPINSDLLSDDKGNVLIYTVNGVSSVIKKKIESCGGEIVELPTENGVINPQLIAEDLWQKEICSVLIEGGGKTLSSFIEADIWDEYHCFIASKFIGNDGIPAFGGKQQEIITLNAASEVKLSASDAHLTYYNRKGVLQCLPEL